MLLEGDIGTAKDEVHNLDRRVNDAQAVGHLGEG